MTAPMSRALARTERLNEIVAACPLHSGRVLRSIALIRPPKRCGPSADRASA